MTKFEENLLQDLLAHHGTELADAERPRTWRPATRPAIVAAGALALAGVLTAGIALSGNSSAAYAVTENPDGTVTVSISEIAAIEPANAKLRELGVRAKAVPETSDCAVSGSLDLYSDDSDWLPVFNPDDSVTIGQDLPVGYTLLLSVSDQPGRGDGLGFTAPVRDPAPDCRLDPALDPALR